MQTQNRIRVVALGLILDGDRVFVYSDYEPIKQRHFYRALGGGVEFGESSLEALQREFQEEIQAELTNIEYLGCIENRFTHLNQPKHEIIQLYRCDFADSKFYQLQEVTFFDGNNKAISAQWVECDRFKSGELWLVPEACLQFL
ncbi:MAG: NUDIX domain-containing protein [Oscillatoriales cyanobacterium C42_A2020_001]|nr:NUDIX domain-containing protein [Leptolyngbyaceae cyanobacterium C42_A2020_001]